jgi:hypothetical protein
MTAAAAAAAAGYVWCMSTIHQVTLNMFQYFMFWAAFYVLRAGRATDKAGCV